MLDNHISTSSDSPMNEQLSEANVPQFKHDDSLLVSSFIYGNKRVIIIYLVWSIAITTK